MTRRRTNSINIYDYPEHLNPFRDDVDDNSDKLNTVGRRRSSFRVNAWTLFSSNKGKSKISEDNNVSSGTHSRFMTWTPKLLRKTSFHRTSPEPVSPISSQLAFRSSTLRSSLPPPNSRSTLSPSNTRSSSSQFTLSPSNSRRTFSPSCRSTPPAIRPTSPPNKTVSPPARPAPPAVRPPLSPRSTLSPGTPSAENAHIVLSVSPVKPSRKISSSAGEQPSEDENKYVQQGARPKKKRRAPPPPPPSSGNTTSDNRQVNLNESDTSMTSSVTSTSAEEPLPQVNSSITTPEPGEVTQHGHESENNSGEGKQQNPTDEQNSCNEKVVPQCNLQDGNQPQISIVNNQQPENMELISRNDTNNRLVTDSNAEQSEEMQASSEYRDHEQLVNEYHSQNKEIVFNTSENDPQQTVCILKDENHIASQNGENGSEDGVMEGQEDESVIKNLKNSSELHNGSHTSFPKNDIRNGMEKVTLTSQLMPEPKPRTILPNITTD